VFLCSDGVDDNYPVDNNEKHLFKLYRTIALTFAEDGFDSTCLQLNGLAGRFATQGKGDDTSIAGFIDMDAAKEAAAVWRGQIEAEKPPPQPEPAKPVEAVKPAARPEPAKPEAVKPEAEGPANIEVYGEFKTHSAQ
jgi:hypothetical protein